MTTVIIDTNVILVANGQHSGVSEPCVAVCASTLYDVMTHGRIAVDSGGLIVDEYLVMTKPYRGKRAGDVFVKWLLRNSYNTARCDQVEISEDPVRGFASFPADERLTHFDMADRKFVAVARSHPDHPRICQATDSKWIDWAPALHDCGIEIEFLCPDEIRRFDEAKKARKEHSAGDATDE